MILAALTLTLAASWAGRQAELSDATGPGGEQSPAATPSLARDLWAAGDRAAAVEQRRLELREHPRPEEALELARWLVTLHRLEAALELLGPAAPGTSEDPLQREQARELRAHALFRLGRYEAALEHLDAGVGLEGLLIVRALLRLGRLEEADRALARAGAGPAEQQPEWLVLEGRRLAREGRHAHAAERFGSALAQDPLDAEALFGRGRALVASGEREAGLQLLRRHRELVPLLDELDFALRAIDLAPRHGAGHAQLADVERRLGRLDRAAASYETAFLLAQEEELVPVALRWARLAEEDLGDSELACQILTRARRASDDPRLGVRLGDTLQRAGQLDAALVAYEQVQLARPADQALARRIAELRARLEDGERR